jgi:hypothetical protein
METKSKRSSDDENSAISLKKMETEILAIENTVKIPTAKVFLTTSPFTVTSTTTKESHENFFIFSYYFL